MDLRNIILNTKRHLNDINSGIFSDDDLKYFINECINRIKMYPYFIDMVELVANSDEPIILPPHTHNLITFYAASRCFFQDERFYEATNFMNDFEYKLEELVQKVESGDIVLRDAEGAAIDISSFYVEDYVQDDYFAPNYNIEDDEGVI
jgi:hypothetical protein